MNTKMLSTLIFVPVSSFTQDKWHDKKKNPKC